MKKKKKKCFFRYGRDVPKNTKIGCTIGPADQCPRRIRVYLMVFICLSMKMIWIIKTCSFYSKPIELKSVNYDLNTVCPRKNINTCQHLCYACFWWKMGKTYQISNISEFGDFLYNMVNNKWITSWGWAVPSSVQAGIAKPAIVRYANLLSS
jgi:hypothetical protein